MGSNIASCTAHVGSGQVISDDLFSKDAPGGVPAAALKDAARRTAAGAFCDIGVTYI